MKKFFRFFALTAIAASVLASCAKQEFSGNLDDVSGKKVFKTFSVNLSGDIEDVSKASIGNNRAILWAENDSLLVWPKNGSGERTFSVVKLVAGAGTNSGTFSGQVPDSPEGYYFCKSGYSSVKMRYSDHSVNPQVEKEQKPLAGQFSEKNLIMAGTSASADGAVNFKTLVGFIKLNIVESSTHKLASIYVQTTLERGKRSEVGGVTLSGAQRITIKDDGTFSYVNSGTNYLTLLPRSGDEIAAGEYWLVAAVSGATIDNLYIILNDTQGNYALLKGGSCKIAANKVIAPNTISPDASGIKWHTAGEIIAANANLEQATLDGSDVEVTGSIEAYGGTADGISWKVQYKEGNDGSWIDSSVSGTGSSVSGTVTGLVPGKTYSFRIVCGALQSNVVERVTIPLSGSRIISWDVTGGFFDKFSLKSGNAIAAAASLSSMTKGTSVYTYDGVDWTFSGYWGFASKKLCAGDAGTLGFPVINGMRLSSVTVDNADASNPRTYSIVDGSGSIIKGGEAVNVAASSTVTFTLEGNTDTTECKLTVKKSGRIQKMTVVYEPYSGTKSGSHENFNL